MKIAALRRSLERLRGVTIHVSTIQRLSLMRLRHQIGLTPLQLSTHEDPWYTSRPVPDIEEVLPGPISIRPYLNVFSAAHLHLNPGSFPLSWVDPRLLLLVRASGKSSDTHPCFEPLLNKGARDHIPIPVKWHSRHFRTRGYSCWIWCGESPRPFPEAEQGGIHRSWLIH